MNRPLFIYGEDDFFVGRRAEVVVRTCLSQLADESLEVFSGRILSRSDFVLFLKNLADAIRNLSLFGKKVLWIRDIDFLKAPSETFLPLLEEFCDLLKEASQYGVFLVLSSANVDRRLKIFKAIGQILDLERVDGKPADLIETIFEEESNRKFLEFSSLSRSTFLLKIREDGHAVAQEMEKLSLFLGKRRQVELSDVEAIVCAAPQEIFFEVLDAFYGCSPNFLASLRSYFSQGDIRPLLAAFQNRNRLLIQLAAAREMGFLTTYSRGMIDQSRLKQLQSKLAIGVADDSSSGVLSQNVWYLSQLVPYLGNWSLKDFRRLGIFFCETFENSLQSQEDFAERFAIKMTSFLPERTKATSVA